MESFIIGVDVGGTFTDAVITSDTGRLVTGKAPTTPDDFTRGFFAAITNAANAASIDERVLFENTTKLAHGSTIGINAVVTGRGAPTLLVATRGHGDVVQMMNGLGRTLGASVEELLDYSRSTRPTPILPDTHVHEVAERMDYAGDVVLPVNEQDVETLLERIDALQVESVAISLLWSFVNPAHELLIRDRILSVFDHLFVTCSHEVAPRIGEYARTVSTVLNAQLGPLMRDYVARLDGEARRRGFTGRVDFAQAEGGLISAEELVRQPVLSLQSGPVAGVIGSAQVGAEMGYPNIIVADMGGTTLDVSTIANGGVRYAAESVVNRQLAFVRNVPVWSIGAGGGSIAWIDDEQGRLRVGPDSAGAVPGPICYGRGGHHVTVTDADLVLGVLNPDRELAGGLRLDIDAAAEAIERLGKHVGLSMYECAAGIVEIIDSRMADLIQRVATQQGLDPRDFTLWAFGGAGGAHAGLFARDLRVNQVVFPMGEVASVWSALGLTVLQPTRTHEETTYQYSPFDHAELQAAIDRLRTASDSYVRERNLVDTSVLNRAAVRYPLQVHEVQVEIPSLHVDAGWERELIERFHRAYEENFGKGAGYQGAGVFVGSLQCTVQGTSIRPALVRRPVRRTQAEPVARRDVYWRELGGLVPTAIYDGSGMEPGATCDGPGVVEYDHTTIVVRPGQRMTVDEFGNVVLDLTGGDR
ncbi:MAG TPA: hydantoinase/oxoprolinase family protein [Acidimicrobiales bacterium]